MSINKEIEFNNIISDILKMEKFIELKYEIHHGISRLDHSLSVAKMTYNACKALGIKNIEEITRAALLHDLFKSDDVPNKSFINHPKVALKNAKEICKLSKCQENIIASHMFPVSCVIPTNIGSWIVSTSDKIVAIKECTRYKIPLTIGATMIFFMNYVIIQR